MPLINSERVDELFHSCLFREDEIVDGKPIVEPVMVEAIFATFGLHPERLEAIKPQIDELLGHLPEQFMEGWSFLNLCTDKHGDMWTGMHSCAERLMALGIAAGRMTYCLPKHLWTVLPGSVPYIQLKPS